MDEGSAAELARLPERARAIVTRLGMRKIPHEGPWFVETHRSRARVEGTLAARYPSERVAYTAILALMTRESFSAFHRLATDELWHFHDGAPLELLLLGAGRRGTRVVLGADVLRDRHPQYLVPRGTWMAARPIGDAADAYSLIGNTLAPGFEYEDYEAGSRATLLREYPAHEPWILALTRDDRETVA